MYWPKTAINLRAIEEDTNNLFVNSSIKHYVNSMLCIMSLVKRSTRKTFEKKYKK